MEIAHSTHLHGSRHIPREDELSDLTQALAKGRTAVLVGVGPSGVGKSVLAQQAAYAAVKDQVLHIRGREVETVLPFGAFERLIGIVEPEDSEMLMVVRRALTVLRERFLSPPLVIIEDAHLIDADSAELLHCLTNFGLVRVLLTVQENRRPADGIVALCTDERTLRIRVSG